MIERKRAGLIVLGSDWINDHEGREWESRIWFGPTEMAEGPWNDNFETMRPGQLF